MAKTRIIAFEGIDGGGKSVQLERVGQRLAGLGYSVARRDYPVYTSFFGKAVGRLLSGADGVQADEVDGRSMALWFALDRWESFKGYRDGEVDILLINRFVLSNAVYQSIRDIDVGKPDIVEWVFELEYGHFGLPRPDVNLLFDVEPALARENVMKKGFRSYVGEGADVYEASAAIQRRAREKYLECAGRFDDIAVIACMANGALLPVDDITRMAMEKLRRRGIG